MGLTNPQESHIYQIVATEHAREATTALCVVGSPNTVRQSLLAGKAKGREGLRDSPKVPTAGAR